MTDFQNKIRLIRYHDHLLSRSPSQKTRLNKSNGKIVNGGVTELKFIINVSGASFSGY